LRGLGGPGLTIRKSVVKKRVVGGRKTLQGKGPAGTVLGNGCLLLFRQGEPPWLDVWVGRTLA